MSLGHDVRFTMRQWSRRPGFAAMAVLACSSPGPRTATVGARRPKGTTGAGSKGCRRSSGWTDASPRGLVGVVLRDGMIRIGIEDGAGSHRGLRQHSLALSRAPWAERPRSRLLARSRRHGGNRRGRGLLHAGPPGGACPSGARTAIRVAGKAAFGSGRTAHLPVARAVGASSLISDGPEPHRLPGVRPAAPDPRPPRQRGPSRDWGGGHRPRSPEAPRGAGDSIPSCRSSGP
jgi:hypothetical protein